MILHYAISIKMKNLSKTFSSCNISTNRARNKGFCLVEALVAVAVGVVMVCMIANILATASRLSLQAKQYFTVTALGVTALEAARAQRAAPPTPSDYEVGVERQAINTTLTRTTTRISPRAENAQAVTFMTMQVQGIIFKTKEEAG